MELYNFQREALRETEGLLRVAYYYEMGTGKTYIGAEHAHQLATKNQWSILTVCQKSKIDDWIDHFNTHYDYTVYNLTNKQEYTAFLSDEYISVGVINYDLLFRRPELKKYKGFILMLDESSLIQNERTKRARFILSMKQSAVILLSGSPVGGRYERLYSQLKLLGLDMRKSDYYDSFVRYKYELYGGFPVMKVMGYRHVDELKVIMARLGCRFLKAEDVLHDLPEQIDQTIRTEVDRRRYDTFRKRKVVTLEDGAELVGDTTLTQLLRERELAGLYNSAKLDAFSDLLESTGERLIVFYNFTRELVKLIDVATKAGRPVATVNGSGKCLENYETEEDSVTFIQYSAGAYGLNLTKARRMVFFTPPLSSEQYEQARKRIHRIGQRDTCFYYRMIAKDTVETRIYSQLALRRDYTLKLFEDEATI